MRRCPRNARRSWRNPPGVPPSADPPCRPGAAPDSTRTNDRRGDETLDALQLALEKAAQLARSPEQMDADRGLVESGHRADLTRRAVAEMTQHEHHALPAVETIDGRCHTGA